MLIKERNELKWSETKLKEALKKTESEAKELFISEKNLKEFLEASLHSNKKLEEELHVIKDELVDTFDQYFKW